MAVLVQMVPLLRPPLCWTSAGCRVTRCSRIASACLLLVCVNLISGDLFLARLETLRTESPSSFGLHSQSMSGGGSDQGAQITSLQQMVNQLQAERDAFAERLQEQEGGVQNHWGRDAGRFRGQHSGRVGAVDGRTPGSRKCSRSCLEAALTTQQGGRVVDPRSSAVETVVDTRRVCERVDVGKPGRLRLSRYGLRE